MEKNQIMILYLGNHTLSLSFSVLEEVMFSFSKEDNSPSIQPGMILQKWVLVKSVLRWKIDFIPTSGDLD